MGAVAFDRVAAAAAVCVVVACDLVVAFEVLTFVVAAALTIAYYSTVLVFDVDPVHESEVLLASAFAFAEVLVQSGSWNFLSAAV